MSVPLNCKKRDSLKALKVALMILAVLALPYASGYIALDTDAGNIQGGCVLLQKQPSDTTKPIGY